MHSVHVPRFDLAKIEAFLRDGYGFDVASLRELGGFFDQNIMVTLVSGDCYLVKIHDANERRDVVEAQNQALLILQGALANVSVQRPIAGLDGEMIGSIDANGRSFSVRVLSYLPGELLGSLGLPSVKQAQTMGETLASMDIALDDFSHSGTVRPTLVWNLENARLSLGAESLIKDVSLRRLIHYFFLQFDTEVDPLLPSLRRQVVHNDGHRNSFLVAETSHQISGIIDFGDLVHAPVICHVAIALADIMLGQETPLESACALLKGYHSINALRESEIDLLYWLIAIRWCVYLLNSAQQSHDYPENDHAQSKSESISEALHWWVSKNPTQITNTFRSALGYTKVGLNSEGVAAELEKRAAYFPASLYTHYNQALYLNRGALQYLHDVRGESYLDCVNNVCQLGHCHPHVVRAIQRQSARLNTNSRYGYDVMTQYAEKLTATMPAPLSVCFFVNSGSEANDLALRLARTYTGNRCTLVLDKAYHGNSTACTDISPQRVDRPGKPGLPDHVRKIEVPDRYRGMYTGSDADVRYAELAQKQVASWAEQGDTISAFIAESLVGTGGQFVLPNGYLNAVYQAVRSRGGLCIADEVQVGFGRTGNQMWCFESQGVVPDIVTLGKPIGNGHPMAAVVTTPEIAASFDGGVTYFNTFGGNPVSCAAGMAVLETLESEDLLANVVTQSGILFAELRRLQEKYMCIGDVRGLGLYIGVELVSDRALKTPDVPLVKAVIEAMKQRGILLNANGYDNNVIKIKPPIIVTERDIFHLINTFDEVLSKLT